MRFDLAVVAFLAVLVCPGLHANQNQTAATQASPVLEAVDLQAITGKAGGSDPQQQKQLQDLLHWAIEHSDPELLKQHAHGVGDKGSSAERVQELHEMMEEMRQEPTEAELIQLAVSVLSNDNSTDPQLLDSLEALSYLAEPIDNANDLRVLGAIGPIMKHLGGSAGLQAAAAHVLGVAAANNLKFQADALEANPRLMHQLLQIAEGDDAQTTARALYAIGAFARSGSEGAALFASAHGPQVLIKLLTEKPQTVTVKRKILDLVADLAKNGVDLQAAGMAGLHAAILQTAVELSWDVRERAWRALHALLTADSQSRSSLRVLGAAAKLGNVQNWHELADEGYREELQHLHASLLSLLAKPSSRVKDEL